MSTPPLTNTWNLQGIVRRGFDFGSIDELKDQAKRGGIRLPGGHMVKTGHRCIYTDPGYVMGDFLKPKNIIRVQGEELLMLVYHRREDDIRNVCGTHNVATQRTIPTRLHVLHHSARNGSGVSGVLRVPLFKGETCSRRIALYCNDGVRSSFILAHHRSSRIRTSTTSKLI